MPEDTAKEIAPRGKEMSDSELLSLIRNYEMASLGSQVAAGATISTTVYPSQQTMTTLEIDRYNALNAYFARPLGNEIENRSQVVLPELRDTIEWMMPQLMRMFVATKTVCRFEAENQQDEQQAEVESQVVNHVFMQMNNGFFILHDFFKDALLMRNGYVEVYTREEKQVTEDKYSGLSEIELTAMLQGDGEEDEKIEVIEQKEYSVTVPMMGPVQLFDLKLRRTAKVKRICVTCLPPEEMRVTPRAREGMEDLAFSMHLTTRVRSDLITDGYDREWVESLQKGRPNWLEIDALARNQVVDQLSIEDPSDFAMQEIEIRKVVMRVDYDGDGVAELRRIIVGGDKIGENEVIEETPFVSCEPLRMPHRHTGISMYDIVMDLQVLKSILWRGGIDNLIIANNTRVAVDWRHVNIDDLLTSRPNAPIRGDGPPAQWIQPIQMPSNIIEQVLPALQYCDDLRAQRTGVGKAMMGLDADELQDVTKGGQLAAMSAASLKLELIARLLAEGVKWIFLKIHSELIRHQEKPMEFELSGKWLKIDPSEWRRRTKVSVNVGLGSGNREEMRANVMLLAQMQAQLAPMGLVGPKQAFESFKLGCDALGFMNPERFAMDPAGPEYAQMMKSRPPPPPDPRIQAAQIKAQSDQQSEQAETQREQMKMQGEMSIEKARLQLEQQKQQEDLGHKAVEGHHDRMVEMGSQHAEQLQALWKALSPIIAAQIKGQMQINAGQTLASDTQSAESGTQ